MFIFFGVLGRYTTRDARWERRAEMIIAWAGAFRQRLAGASLAYIGRRNRDGHVTIGGRAVQQDHAQFVGRR